MRVLSENLANAQSTGKTPGSDPYARKVISFESQLDEATGTNFVKVSGIDRHQAPFRIEHNPGHPAADAKGFVKLPNVDMLVEVADMREANRSYRGQPAGHAAGARDDLDDDRPAEERLMIERISPSPVDPCCAFNPRGGCHAPGCRRRACSEAAGVDFGSMLGDLAAKTAGDVRNAETLSIAGVRGQASVQQVVEAVMSAEQSLQTAIAVRDKVVSAYLEISRMSI